MDDPNGMWAVVEVMGHKRFAGWVTEQVIAGTGFVRVDVPGVGEGEQAIAAFSKFFGTKSIYAITPTDEETARRMAGAIRETPIDRWVLQVGGGQMSLPSSHDFDDDDEQMDPEE